MKQGNGKYEAGFLLLLLFSSTRDRTQSLLCLSWARICRYHSLTPIHDRVSCTEEPSCLGQIEWELETIVGGKVREHTGRQGQITLELLTSLGIGFSVFLF